MDADRRHMRRALRLARRAEGRVEPNPMVGCVIARGDRVVGEGWHRRYGEPHAEVEALRRASDAARGATVYVTLEPCCQHGKTPPCTEALIEAGVRRVVIGAVDPTPAGSGRGIARLEAAGITVERSPEGETAARLIAPFLKRATTGLPYVTLKWAATVDGAIATAEGDSQWISNERSRRLVHQMRGRVDVVMVGIGTALADDPRLTARGVRRRRVARRVVVDPQLKLPEDSRLVASLAQAPLTLGVAQPVLESQTDRADRLRRRGVELAPLPSRDRSGDNDGSEVDLSPLLGHLAETHEATNVLVEGGAGLAGRLVDQQLVDELMVFVAPKLLAVGSHLPPVRPTHDAPGAAKMARAWPLKLLSTRRLGGDVLLRYQVPTRPAPAAVPRQRPDGAGNP